MRILIACHSPERVGGVESYIAAIAPALAARGHEIGMWYEDGGGAREAPAVSHTTWTSAVGAGSGAAWTASDDERAALDGARRWQPDVIFVQGLRSPILERRLLELAPAVLFAHSYYGTCISGSKTHASPATVACSRRFGPACIALYHARRCGGWSPATMLQLYGVQSARLSLLPAYRRLVVASRHMQEEYARHGLAERTTVIPLPSPAAQAVEGPAPRLTTWRLLYIGRLEWLKGPDLALEAAARVASRERSQVALTIAGIGQLSESLKRRATDLTAAHPGLRVEFTGWLEPAGVAKALTNAHLLVVPSRWPEPFGLVGVEAGLHGVPAVAFATGGISEWLRDDVNGVLVTGRSPGASALATGIVRALEDEKRFARLRSGAREIARTFDMARHAASIEAVLAEAAGTGMIAAGADARRGALR